MAEAKSTGCIWIEGRTRKWDGKKGKFVMVQRFCHKLLAPGSAYCPKHEAMRQATPVAVKPKEAEPYY